MRYQPFSLSLLKSCGLRTCGLESKVLASKAWRRKCSPRNDWKQCCVLGRQEDPELQECFKSLPFLSAACIYIFFSPPNSCWMKVWFYTLMHVAHLAWAETAESTGALLSTWHNNHHEYVMSSSIRNKSRSYAQNHFMHISISNTGPSIVYTSRDIRWKAFNYLLRKVSCKKFIKCKVWVTLCKLRI